MITDKNIFGFEFQILILPMSDAKIYNNSLFYYVPSLP